MMSVSRSMRERFWGVLLLGVAVWSTPSVADEAVVSITGDLKGRTGAARLFDALLGAQERVACIDISVPLSEEIDRSNIADEKSFAAFLKSSAGQKDLKVVIGGDRAGEIVTRRFIAARSDARVSGAYRIEAGSCGGGCVFFGLEWQQAIKCGGVKSDIKRISLN